MSSFSTGVELELVLAPRTTSRLGAGSPQSLFWLPFYEDDMSPVHLRLLNILCPTSVSRSKKRHWKSSLHLVRKPGIWMALLNSSTRTQIIVVGEILLSLLLENVVKRRNWCFGFSLCFEWPQLLLVCGVHGSGEEHRGHRLPRDSRLCLQRHEENQRKSMLLFRIEHLLHKKQ
jgi:hypothetical protein